MPLKKTNRQTVYFGPHLSEHVSGLKGGSVSGRLDKTAERYDAIMEESKTLEKSLTDEEIKHVDMVLGDKKIEMVDIHWLALDIAEWTESDVIDVNELSSKLEAANIGELVRLVEHLGR